MATCKEYTDGEPTPYRDYENVLKPPPPPRRCTSLNRTGVVTESSNETDDIYEDGISVENESGESLYEEHQLDSKSEHDYEDLEFYTDDDIYERLRSAEPQKELRLVMVGKTGAGKSATANLIIPGKTFMAMPCGKSVTRQCQRASVKLDGYKISIIDTPGLFDTDLSVHEIRTNIIDCIQLSVPGPHVFLIIIQIGRFTSEEIDALDNLFQIFGNSMETHAMLVFTRYDDLQRDGISIENYLKNGGERLQSYVKKCKNRYIAVNNYATGEEKNVVVKEFIDNVVKIAEVNNFKPYTHEMIEEANRNVQPLLVKAEREKVTANREAVKEIESQYEAIRVGLKEERELLADKIRKCTETRDRLLENKRMRLLENNNVDSASNEVEQCKLNNIDTELALTYQELEQHTEKQQEIENEYAEVKRRKRTKIISLRKKQHEKMLSELLNIKDEHFKQMDILLQNISIIEQQLDGVDRELETVKRKADKKKLTARRAELLKERKKAGDENMRYIGQMMEKSSNLQKQLARKGKICRIM